MPYRLRKAPNRDLYWVVAEDGTKKSKDPIPLDRAKAQMRALYSSMEKSDMRGSGLYKSNFYRLLRNAYDEWKKSLNNTEPKKEINIKKRIAREQLSNIYEKYLDIFREYKHNRAKKEEYYEKGELELAMMVERMSDPEFFNADYYAEHTPPSPSVAPPPIHEPRRKLSDDDDESPRSPKSPKIKKQFEPTRVRGSGNGKMRGGAGNLKQFLQGIKNIKEYYGANWKKLIDTTTQARISPIVDDLIQEAKDVMKQFRSRSRNKIGMKKAEYDYIQFQKQEYLDGIRENILSMLETSENIDEYRKREQALILELQAEAEERRRAEAEAERKRAEAERKRAEAEERKRAEAEERKRAEAERKRAEAERKRAEAAERKRAEEERKAKAEAERKKAERRGKTTKELLEYYGIQVPANPIAPTTAEKREARKRYNKVVLELHPDKGGDKEDFQQFDDAYKRLYGSGRKGMGRKYPYYTPYDLYHNLWY